MGRKQQTAERQGMDMRETLQRAVDMVFREVPFSRRNDEFKEEVLESAFRKYQTSRSEGATEAEAAGEGWIVSEAAPSLADGGGAG